MSVAETASALRVTTTHVVSSNDWVSRTTITGRGLAMAVRDGEDGLWLVSTRAVLAPDPVAVRQQAEQQGGPPSRQSKVTLAKVVLDVPQKNLELRVFEPVTLRMPLVVLDPLGEAAVIAIPASSAAVTFLGGSDTPIPVRLDDLDTTPLLDATRLRVSSLFSAEDGTPWSVTRWTTLASAPTGGFVGRAGVVALDLRLAAEEQGAPVMAQSDAEPRCVGLAVQLCGGQAAMVLAERIIQAILGSGAA